MEPRKKIKKEVLVDNSVDSDDGDDDDCVILDCDPNRSNPVKVSAKDSVNLEADEVLVISEKGQVPCRDYPHARHMCVRFPLSMNPREKYCCHCHCYVCDTPAPCIYWGTGVSSGDHCNSNDKEELWRLQRKSVRKQKGYESEEEEIVTSCILEEKLTGCVEGFDIHRGYGYIFPDNGSENLFFHRSSIKSAGCENLNQGEKVVFQMEISDYMAKAVNVFVLGRSHG